MRRASTWRALLSVLRSTFIALFAAGCPATHGPESADTATSWLHACVGDGECTGASRCIAHLCSISCEERRDSCTVMARDARCEQPVAGAQSMCDLRCDGDGACTVLGVGYTCQQGFCRPESALEVQSQRLTLMDPAPGSEVWPSFDPLVTWTGDRFRIAISGGSPEQPHPMSVLEVFELFPDTTLVSRGRPTASTRVLDSWITVSAQPLAINKAGTVAIGVWTTTAAGSAAAAFAEVQFLVPGKHEPIAIECPWVVEVAPARQGNDWLVLCHDDEGAVRLGRFDPTAEHWSSPLRPVLERLPPGDRVSMSVQGEDALLWQSSVHPGRTARILNAAGGSARLSDQPLLWHVLADEPLRTSESGYFASWLNGDWLVPQWVDEVRGGPNNIIWSTTPAPMQSPVAFRLLEDGAPSGPVRFPLSVAHETRLNSVQGLPERGEVAFCFEEYGAVVQGRQLGELLVSLFDERGNRVDGPHRLSGKVSHGTCRLAWSGSQLLATWLQDDENGDEAQVAHARVLQVR